MRLHVTHLLFTDDPRRPPDGLGRALPGEGSQGDQRRLFIPGWLPCGECGSCRRGLVASCPRAQTPFAGVPGPPRDPLLLASERFLIPVDDGGAPPLEDGRAACAGIVAEVLEVAARAGLGPGDLTIWAGADVRCLVGARWSAARGCPSFVLRSGTVPASPGVVALDRDQGPQGWQQTLAASAQVSAQAVRERRLFLGAGSEDDLQAALALVEPGTTVSFLGGAPSTSVRSGDLPSCRVLIGARAPGGYHPDLVPEALASLAKGELELADLVASTSAADSPAGGGSTPVAGGAEAGAVLKVISAAV